jgi:hypothetical protein
VVDSQQADTNRPDTNRPDTNQWDTNQPDTSQPDTNQPDTNQPDTSQPDTNQPDTNQPDTNQPDTNQPDGGPLWTPGDVSGLMLWLDPSVGVTGTSAVSQWVDRSANAIVLSQTATKEQPAFEVSNGHPTVGFAAGPDGCTWLRAGDDVIGEKLNLGTSDVLFAVVLRSDNLMDSPPAGLLYKCNFDTDPYRGIQIYSNEYRSGSSVNGRPSAGLSGYKLIGTEGNTNDLQFHVIVFIRRGTTQYLRYDGKEVDQGYFPAESPDSMKPLYIGNRPDCVHANTGLIGDVIAIKDDGVSDLDKVESYLKAKYGIK